jgi:hypothetical protein
VKLYDDSLTPTNPTTHPPSSPITALNHSLNPTTHPHPPFPSITLLQKADPFQRQRTAPKVLWSVGGNSSTSTNAASRRVFVYMDRSMDGGVCVLVGWSVAKTAKHDEFKSVYNSNSCASIVRTPKI